MKDVYLILDFPDVERQGQIAVYKVLPPADSVNPL